MNKLLRYLLSWAVVPLLACVCFGAQQPATPETQRFVVLGSNHLVGPSQELTGKEANCVITGSGDDARMKCKPLGITAKNYYNYNSALVVNAEGTAYIIACRIALFTNLWCKGIPAGKIFRGNITGGRMVMADAAGDKPRNYLILMSAAVGPPTSGLSPLAEKEPAPARQPNAATPAPSAPSANNNRPAESAVISTGDSGAACMSSTGACVSFVSDPSGADIYVDGKFVGNTPSMLPLSVGAHQIRMEAEKNAPWTRSFEASAGSKVTIRATLQASPARP